MSWTGEPGPEGPKGPVGGSWLTHEEHACESNTVWKLACLKEASEVSSMWLVAWVSDPRRYHMTTAWHQPSGEWTLDRQGVVRCAYPDWYSEFPCWPPLLPEFYPSGPPGEQGESGSP